MTTPAQRSEIARMGAYAMYAKYDGKQVAARRMETRMRKYREQADPTGELAKRNPRELEKRAEALLKQEMARVRLAKSQRASERARLVEMARETPSNDMAQLGAVVEAWTLNSQAALRLDTDEAELRTLMATYGHGETQIHETASALTEAVPQPQISRNTRKNFSDGGNASVSHAPRRRQTTTPTSTPKSKGTKKAATRGNSSKSLRD